MTRSAKMAAGGALLALPYAPFALGWTPGGGGAGVVLVCVAALVAPGAAGMLLPGSAGTAGRFVRALGVAAVLQIAAIGVLRIAGVQPTPRTLAIALGAITVATGLVGVGRGGTLPGLRRNAAAVAVAAAAFTLAAWAGLAVVPPLEDQDMEVQGTAWGIVHDLDPVCLTNRSTLRFFAHPPLLHLLNATTLSLSGELDAVRSAYDAARAAERGEGDAPRGLRAVAGAIRGKTPRPDRSLAWNRDVYAAFRTHPALAGTRAPNFVLAAAVAVLLFAWGRRLGAGVFDAALVTLAYATLPEVVVRSGYGGYYALTAATLTAGAWLASERAGGGRAAFSAGTLAALANQKALLLALGAAAGRMAEAVRARNPRLLRAAFPAVLGVAAGWAAFALYGLGTDPVEFVTDHLLGHGVGRFAGGEVLDRAGSPTYPGRIALWGEFAAHLGWAWTLLAAFSLVWVFRAWIAHAAAARALLLPAVWVAAGAVLFTLTDWRQTKHLCLLVPALAVLMAALVADSGLRVRWLLRSALFLSLAHNAYWMVRLAENFHSLAPTPLW
ncbi:MAG: hypothetical protein QF819_00100 [Gemmatimonadota bacterium]|jgi:hypothetical protein|nr:hypothetical protein [Gemmatimonadota bacterium]MDP6801564.1 hypothetical protein [Gemmatimonadota bacterium]MDP7030889.1 hypothetical protein [Gemmatimonadota bacterium]